MSLREAWWLPTAFREDGSGSGSLATTRPAGRADNRQKFFPDEIDKVKSGKTDYDMADLRWKSQYKFPVGEERRRFAICLAIAIGKKNATSVRAEPFYIGYSRSHPTRVSIRCLRNWAKEADDLGLFSIEKGGEDTGVETALGNQACLFFTSYQKYRLLIACGAQSEQRPLLADHKGRLLCGPAK